MRIKNLPAGGQAIENFEVISSPTESTEVLYQGETQVIETATFTAELINKVVVNTTTSKTKGTLNIDAGEHAGQYLRIIQRTQRETFTVLAKIKRKKVDEPELYFVIKNYSGVCTANSQMELTSDHYRPFFERTSLKLEKHLMDAMDHHWESASNDFLSVEVVDGDDPLGEYPKPDKKVEYTFEREKELLSVFPKTEGPTEEVGLKFTHAGGGLLYLACGKYTHRINRWTPMGTSWAKKVAKLVLGLQLHPMEKLGLVVELLKGDIATGVLRLQTLREQEGYTPEKFFLPIGSDEELIKAYEKILRESKKLILTINIDRRDYSAYQGMGRERVFKKYLCSVGDEPELIFHRDDSWTSGYYDSYYGYTVGDNKPQGVLLDKRTDDNELVSLDISEDDEDSWSAFSHPMLPTLSCGYHNEKLHGININVESEGSKELQRLQGVLR